ncbi:MAG: hypothetical protein IKJ09_06785 [Bacteroidaceae bacterium]|nr:hypothetical protein [Bacteroidaceae bacterium]
MKKMYVKPEIEIIELELESHMATISGNLDGVVDNGDSEGGREADANRHRGEWGNLWAED